MPKTGKNRQVYARIGGLNPKLRHSQTGTLYTDRIGAEEKASGLVLARIPKDWRRAAEELLASLAELWDPSISLLAPALLDFI